MPVKINGTTIIDEVNFADKNLSNLSETGLAVITNAASSAGTNYMKKINTKNGSYGSISDSSPFTTTSDGWIILQHTESNAITLSVGSSCRIGFKSGDDATISFPVCSGTVFSKHEGTGSVSYIFFPEVS